MLSAALAMHLLGFLFVTPATAERGKDSLRGLKAVVFSVTTFGTTSRPVLPEIEGQLRMAGLRLLSDDEAPKGTPHLDLDLTLACNGSHDCGYTVRLGLTQRVRLSRRLDIETTATTWYDGYQNGIHESDVPATLMELYAADARTLIKFFLDDYEAVNPRR